MLQVISYGTVLEQARLWDALSREVPAAAFPATSFGEYLDYHAEALGLARKEPAYAGGEVLFTGTPGTLVPSDLRLSVTQTDPDIDPPEYKTVESGVISTALATPTGLGATGSTASGSLPAATYYYKVAAINEYGATLPSSEVNATIAGTGRVSLDWTDVPGASGYHVYRSTSAGTEKYLATVVDSAYLDSGVDIATAEDPPASNTTGGQFRATIEALEFGSASNVGADAIDTVLSPIIGIATVMNEEPITGGSDDESDEDLRARILLEYLGGGPGNVADYERWALVHPGVGRVTVVPVANGAGTVTVIVMDVNGDPVPNSVIDSLQYTLDPLAGQGAGTAPIGASVTVTTPETVLIDIVAAITFEAGYTLDGAGGIVALRDRITDALAFYLDHLDAGEDVIYDHVKAQFYTVPGVWKVTSLTVEGGTADVSITSTPSQIAALGTTTLS